MKPEKPGLSSTVLPLLLAKQESTLLGVSVHELLAGDSPRFLLGDTNHHESSLCLLVEGRGLATNSNVLGLSSAESCCIFQRRGVGGKTMLGSGRRGTCGSLFGDTILEPPELTKQLLDEVPLAMAGTLMAPSEGVLLCSC